MSLPISLARFTVVWVTMAVAMSANGVFRELVLKHHASSSTANVLSAALGVAIIALITRVGFRPLSPADSRVSLATLAVALVVLTALCTSARRAVADNPRIPCGDTVSLGPLLAATIVFERDAAGHVTGYVQQQPDGFVARARRLPDG